MPAESTELWGEQSSAKTADGWTANRGWLVTGAATDEEARNAIPLDGRPIPPLDASHDDNISLKVRELPVSPGKGPRSRIVRAIYAIPASGSFGGDATTSPLSKPAEYFVEHVARSEPLEVDASPAKIAVTNSAGDPFDPPATNDVFDVLITIVRNEPFFPLAKSIAFRNVVNALDYNIPKVGLVGKGLLLSLPMRLGSPVTEKSTYCEVIYSLMVRQDGWRTRIPDKGTQGWYQDGSTKKKGRFRASDGAVTEPILLDGTGKPLLIDSYSVMTAQGSWTTPVDAPSRYYQKDYVETAGGVNFMRFYRFPEVSFQSLL